MSEVLDRPTGRACEDCDTELVQGPVPIDIAGEDPDVVASGETAYADWCPNPDCLSNHVIPGLTRVGVRRYICLVCRRELTGPISQVFARTAERTDLPQSERCVIPPPSGGGTTQL